ncbi:MAG: hypothetical protein JSV80_18215 [Acidobacteriota bacterium]|nr:MAG: hypothetical protein JSV80_18215 [Acidobacteriota bacterium]
MENYEQITQAIYEALDELAASMPPDEAPEKAPETVLIGEEAKLDSVSFVMFALSLEGNIEQTFQETVSVMDFVAAGDELTVDGLAKRIARKIGAATKT